MIIRATPVNCGKNNNRVSKSFGRHLDCSDKMDDKNVVWRLVYKHKCEVKYHKIEAKVKKMELIRRIHLKVA